MVRGLRLASVTFAALALLGPARAETASHHATPVPVLLTFDVEADADVVALRELAIDVPATYFVTGAFAQKYPDLVRQLAERGTIGSHTYSHPHLTELTEEEVHKDLFLSQLVLEDVIGQKPVWLRAPYLELDDDVLRVAGGLGFRFSSSDEERWREDRALTEIPISQHNDILASDFELFTNTGMTSAQAEAWLESAYIDRDRTGRPLVILLHPHVIVEHAATLHDFIAFAKTRDAAFVTTDGYQERALAARPKRVGFWVDFTNGAHDPAILARDVAAVGVTDVFVMAKDPEGKRYFVDDPAARGSARDLFGRTLAALAGTGARVHAWLPVNHDSQLAKLHPQWAMLGSDGKRSGNWLSPASTQARRAFLDTVRTIVDLYEVRGIHLDYIRFPSLSYDFSEEAVRGFAQTHDLRDQLVPDDLLSAHYVAWTDWRGALITRQVEEIAAFIRTSARPATELSAALIAEAAMFYRAREKFGQDYAALGPSLDLVMPMAYFRQDERPVEWIADIVSSVRYQVGVRPLLVGVESYQEPGEWTIEPQLFERSLKLASEGSDGVVAYSYLYLFGRGQPERNMAPEAIESVRALAALARAPAAGETPLGLRSSLTNILGAMAGTPSEKGPAVLFAVIGTTALVSIVVVLVRVTGRRPTGHAPDQGGLPAELVSLGDCTRLEKHLDGGPQLDPEVFSQVCGLLRRLGPLEIERYRIVRVLELVAERARAPEDILRHLGTSPAWRILAMRYLHEALELGLIEPVESTYSVTEDGRRELDRALATGFSADGWAFVERCLAERLIAICPHCGTRNPTRWFWPDIECRSCGRSSPMAEAAAIGRAQPDLGR